MYPIHLEAQHERYMIRVFDRFADRLRHTVLPRLQSEALPLAAGAETTTRRHDAPDDDIYEFLESLRRQYGDWIDRAELEAQITRNFTLLDAHSKAYVDEQIDTITSRLNADQPITGSASRGGTLPGISLLSESGLTQEQIDSVVKTNLSLVEDLTDSQFEDIQRILTDGLTQGKGYKAIVDEMEEATGVNRNRAAFWGRDQASKFFGEVQRTRQTSAGFPGYIWRTMQDSLVRDTHSDLEGTYHEWSKPPRIIRTGGQSAAHLHPGEDYNCRCWAEPAVGPEWAEKEYRPPAPSNDERPDDGNNQEEEVSAATDDWKKENQPDVQNETEGWALDQYVGSGHHETLNDLLRDGATRAQIRDTYLRRMYDGLRRILYRSSVSAPTVVYRGLRQPVTREEVYHQFPLNGIVDDLGFLSTTVSEEKALMQIDRPTKMEKQVLLKLAVPSGAKAVYIGDVSALGHEEETLFDAGRKFQVVNVQETTDMFVVEGKLL